MISSHPTLDDTGSMVVKNFGPTQPVLLGSPKQLARQGIPVSPKDLERLDTVAMSAVDGRVSWHLEGPDKAAFTLTHRPRYVADDLLTLKYAVTAGIGICLLPGYMCSAELSHGELVQVLPGWAPPPAIFHAVFPTRRGLVPAIRSFLDFLGDMIQEENYVFPA